MDSTNDANLLVEVSIFLTFTCKTCCYDDENVACEGLVVHDSQYYGV